MRSFVKKHKLVLIAAFAALLNLIPLMLVTPAGDVVMNYAQVSCFSKQLWQGIFYPRWCMDANGGLGSPAPIFYFPLPFYITALFHPLHLGAEKQYLAGIFLANMAAFICCYLWLRKSVGEKAALFSAFIFLWGFYRAEMMARASYAEYWCVAFMPLLFHYARDARAWAKLTIAIAICFFCHAPATLIALIATGLYLLLNTNIRALASLTLASLLAGLLALPHYAPMKLLANTLNPIVGGYSHWRQSWVNSFADQPELYLEHSWALIGSSIGFISFIVIAAIFWKSHKTIPQTVQNEGLSWIAIGLLAFFMMLSPSHFLWIPIEIISGVATPWRMQMLIMFALVMCFALMSQYIWFRNEKTRTGDAVLASLFFIFGSLFYAGGVADGSMELFKKHIRPAQFIIPYFATYDMDPRYRRFDNFAEDLLGHTKAEWLAGEGTLHIDQWNNKGIVISGHAEGNATLVLGQFNYPIWQATLNGAPIAIASEPVTGRMQVTLPSGDFRLRIVQDYAGMFN